MTSLSIHLVLVLKTSYWYTSHPFYRSFSPGCDLDARECFDGPAASQQGMLGALIVWWPASFWLQWTMAEGTVHTGSPAKFPTKPTEEWIKIRKMYAIKQIKICAEYRDMLPRPRLDLSGTPGLRPIGLSPGSWQTSLGLGSMSRYSAQILICIISYISYTYPIHITLVVPSRQCLFTYYLKTVLFKLVAVPAESLCISKPARELRAKHKFIACWWPFCHAITSTKCPRALGTLTRPWNVYPSNSAFFNYFLSNHCCSLATIMSYHRMNEKLSNDVCC